MALWIRRMFLVAVALSFAPFSDDHISVPAPQDEAAETIGQVRLRKLHLVRPDLIPYPISFEVHA